MLAQALFEDGRRLVQEQRYDEGCAKFAESQRLDPGIGTQFHLADCLELAGKLATAWIQFVDVAAAAHAAAQADRARAARRRAERLGPRLTKLRIAVESDTPGLEIRRDGRRIAPAQLGTPVPVEPGRYLVEARAPGRRTWRKRVEAQGEGVTVDVLVPELAPAPPGATPVEEEPTPPPEGGSSIERTAALVMGAVGIAGLAAGTAAGIVAIERKGAAEEFCPEPDACFDEGLDRREQARTAAGISTLAFATGASALAAAIVLWLSAGDEPTPARADTVRLELAPAGLRASW
jgi:hypothetical protein